VSVWVENTWQEIPVNAYLRKNPVACRFSMWHGSVMENTLNIATARDVIGAAGGRDAVAVALNVVPRYVSDAARDGQLPAAWFDCLERMVGQQLPRRLFSFKGETE
jgi:hypothetical protein